jgi:TolA-binding protein
MKLWMAVVFGSVLMAATPVYAQSQVESREGIALQNQILKLQNDVQSLRGEIGRGGSSSGSSSFLGGSSRPPQPAAGAGGDELMAQMLGRVERLEDQLRQLNGRIDELDNGRQRGQADLAKQIADLQFRLDAAGVAGGNPAPSAAPVSPNSQAPTPLGTMPVGAAPAAPLAAAPPGKRTAELALQEGNAALARRDYVGAEASAREVLATAKATPRGYDAQFLLGQAMLGQKNYTQAAVAFADTYDRNKPGSHAQDSLYEVAYSLNAINQKHSACEALDSLRAQFPTPRADLAPRVTALRASAGCH